ncbi:MAG TPA: SUMF1/EgtB/PvdO family nonheme iron enzyme, partial [Planctomycetota bacterium]|nr:SUMF1/EgtB/PvdO family nonheme iron enzyme [Planctomycetota bacterium]
MTDHPLRSQPSHAAVPSVPVFTETAWDAAGALSLKSHRAGDFLGQPYLLIRPIPDWHAPWWLALDCRDNTYRAVLETGSIRTRIHPLLDIDLYLLPDAWPAGVAPRLLTLPLPALSAPRGGHAPAATPTTPTPAPSPVPDATAPAVSEFSATSLPDLNALPRPLESRIPVRGLPPAAVWQLLAPLVQRLSRALTTGVRDSLEDFLEFTLPALAPGYLMLAPGEARLQLIGWTAADLALVYSPGLFACLPPEWSAQRPSLETVLGAGYASAPSPSAAGVQNAPKFDGAHAAPGTPAAAAANPPADSLGGPVGEYIKTLRRTAAEQAGYALAATALWLVRGRPPFSDKKEQAAGWAFRAALKTRPAVLPRKPFEDMPQFAKLLKQLLQPNPAQRAIPDPSALYKSWEQAAPPGDALEKLRACLHCGSLKSPRDTHCWLCGNAQKAGDPAGISSTRNDNLSSGRRRSRTGRAILTPPGIRFYCLACHAPLHAAHDRAGTLGRCPLCSAFNEIPRTSNRASGAGHEVYLDPPIHPDPEAAPRVYVPAGPFASGVEAISVILPAFAIDAHPVTNGQYTKFFQQFKGNRNRGQPRVSFPPHIEDIIDPEKALLPVVGLTYAQAEYYAQAHAGRIPSALEWERCARGPEGRRYPWGEDFNPLYCNHRRYCEAVAQLGDNPGHLPVITQPSLLPVGAIERDAGFSNFRDPAGNVAEWTNNRREIY